MPAIDNLVIQKKALLIINRHSRLGSTADFREAVSLLEAAGIQIEQLETASASQTSKEIDEHHQKVDFVILAGGDGTISSAATALYRHKLKFAIFPMGTANDLARSLGIPCDLVSASEAIIAGFTRPVDLGMVNGHHFFNVANIGLGVDVTHELTAELKKKWGVFSYLKALNAALSHRKTFYATIVCDGKEQRLRSIHLAVGNGRYYGGGNIIDENAFIDSGLLCLYSLKPQSAWELISLAPLLRGGRHSRLKRIFSTTGRRIEVRTFPNLEVDADGEPVARTPVVFEVIPSALQVFAPKELCPDAPPTETKAL